MYQRFFLPPEASYFLIGPRGTGKSTWLHEQYEEAYWIDLLNPEQFRQFSVAPERLRALLEVQEKRVVIIDEVQRVPQLLNVVHSLIEEKRGYQFVMTGSSARKLRRGRANLLAGRALMRHMPPFFASEIEGDFQLAKNIKLGMLPIVLDAPSPEEVLRAYVGVYLKEEVQEEGIVRNVGDFARFLEAMSFSHAALINASNISREAQIARKTVESYLLIINDLLLAFQITPFREKAKRSLVSHSKLYFFDSGVFYSLRPHNLFDVESEKEGPALEGLVAQHLKGWIDAQEETYHLNFWRTSSHVEVDFIVTGPNSFLAIEVKNGVTLHPKDFRGLEEFAQDYPEVTPLLLYRGSEIYRQGKVLCFPVEAFLKSIKPQQPLTHAL